MQECTTCHKKLEENTAVKGEGKPEHGSISICFGCGLVGVFEKDLIIREITNDELNQIAIEDPKAYQMICITVKCIQDRIKQN